MQSINLILLISLSVLLVGLNSLSIQNVKKTLASLSVAAGLTTPAIAHASNVVGEFTTSGIIFKDTLKVNEFTDPKVEGVSIYLTEFERPINEKLSKDFFNDPSSTSLTCARTGPIKISTNIARGKGGEEVFEENKNLFFKAIRVQRIYDEKTNTLLYVSYNTRFDKKNDDNKSRFKSSICAIHFDVAN